MRYEPWQGLVAAVYGESKLYKTETIKALRVKRQGRKIRAKSSRIPSCINIWKG